MIYNKTNSLLKVKTLKINKVIINFHQISKNFKRNLNFYLMNKKYRRLKIHL